MEETYKHQDGMQWKGTPVVFQYAIVAVNAADRTSTGKSESQRKAFCATLPEFQWQAEDFSQDELFFT